MGKPTNLGAIDKSFDIRDIDYELLGGAGRPLPNKHKSSFAEEMVRHSQKSTPTCGAHAGAHSKQLLDVKDTGKNAYSPFYLWKKIKVVDGYPPEVGTDLRSVLKALKQYGVCDLDLLPYQGNKKIATYSVDDTTKQQNDNAKPRLIGTYAFMGGDRHLIKQAIYDNGSAILHLKFGEDWWKNSVMTSNGDKSRGHFVAAYGWVGDDILIIDSSDDKQPFKVLKPTFQIKDSGVLTDVPDSEVRGLINKLYWLQKLISLFQRK